MIMPMDPPVANRAFDAETTQLLAATFDTAWKRVEASGSLPADEGHVAAAREFLAKCIIALVQQGQTDGNRLIESALLRLRIVLRHDVEIGDTSRSRAAANEQMLSDRPPKAELSP
jgi:hypothetical protein